MRCGRIPIGRHREEESEVGDSDGDPELEDAIHHGSDR